MRGGLPIRCRQARGESATEVSARGTANAHGVRETQVEQRTAFTLRFTHGSWCLAARDQSVQAFARLLGQPAQCAIQLHVQPSSRLAVIQRTGRDYHVKHLFEAKGLGAELHAIRIV